MSPKAKNKSFPPVKVTERLLEETMKCAEATGKDGVKLSEYIRQAVEAYNAQQNTPECEPSYTTYPKQSTHKNNTDNQVQYRAMQEVDQLRNRAAEMNGHKNNTVSKEISEEIDRDINKAITSYTKAMQPKSTMVKPLTKGGK